jgi:arylsulfatase A-like enzyme
VARQPKRQIEQQLSLTTDLRTRLHGVASRLWTGRPLEPNLALLAAAWFLLAALELVLNALIPGSAVRDDHLPLGARFLLICYSFAVLTFFLVPIGASLKLVAWVTRRFVPTRTVTRWATDGLIIFLIWFVLLLYGASWATFWQIGTFLDSQVFLFLVPNPIQVFHWVDVDVALTVLALTLAVTFMIGSWMPRWIAQRQLTTQRQLVLAWSAAISISVTGAFFGNLYSHWGERQYTRLGILYAKSHDKIAGPFPYVLTDIRRNVRSQPEEPSTGTSMQIIQRPIIPMSQYLASIGHRKINRWNVIILIVESLRADQLRVYGGRRDVMPAVDILAPEARVFLNAYAQASHTDYATLTPLSSHYPLRSTTSYSYPEHPTYPRVLIYDVLKALGYHTAIFSSSNEYWRGMIHYLQTGNVDRLFHAATFKGPTYVMRDDAGFAAWVRETQHAGSVDDRFTMDEAIHWIDSLNSEPFFISLNFQNSHLPYVVPRDFPHRFGPAKLDFTIRFAHFPQDKIQVVKDVYADSLLYVDSQIARLIQYLKQRGMWERTIVVLTGDHGQAFYEHGFAAHAGPIFNEVMKVPLVIRAPGLEPDHETRPAQQVDVTPSVLDLLGLPPHPSFQGISLFDAAPKPNRSVYMLAQTPQAFQYGIIRSGFKLIYDEWQQQYSLYDLTADPEERNDLAAYKPELVKELSQRLQTWRKLQIDYYTDERLQAREYPPVLAD